jgi:methionyl aminopeptidase
MRRSASAETAATIYGFPGTLLISVNDEVVHGIPGSRRLEAGDVVKFDVTVEKDGYMADAARTMLLDSKCEVARRRLTCVQVAFRKALTAVVLVGRKAE